MDDGYSDINPLEHLTTMLADENIKEKSFKRLQTSGAKFIVSKTFM